MPGAIIATCLVLLLFLSDVVEVSPSILRCLLRSKENENLANSMNLSICRNHTCLALFLPVVILTAQFGLYQPALDYAEPGSLNSILICAGVWLVYFLLRVILRGIAKKISGEKKFRQREWQCVTRIPYTFFALLGFVMISSTGIMMLRGANDETIRITLLWEMAGIYFICLLHKTYFFVRYRGFFSAFLYLCTLEILPSGLLILSALVL